MSTSLVRRLALCATALTAAACADRGNPVGALDPAPKQPTIAAAVKCTANVRAGSVRCGDTQLPGGARGYIVVGRQHVNVELTSSNVSYDGSVFSFDVTVKNLIPQTMATTDGVTPDSTGVRVFFVSGPDVVSGSGNASLANADGSGTFTASNQPYFSYTGSLLGADSLLSTNETSGARNWQINLDNTVTEFQFTVWITTEVHYPTGYIDLFGGVSNMVAGDSMVLTDSVRTAVGTLVDTATVTWASSDSSVATVDASGHVHGLAEGAATITATSGTRSGSVTVNVCPNLAVGEAFTTTAQGGATVCFAGGAGGAAEYTYMPVNLSASSSLSAFTVTGSGIQGVTGPPSPVRLPLNGLRSLDDEALQIASDVPYLERDLPRLNGLLRHPSSRVSRGRRSAPAGLRSIITQNVVPAVGDLMDLNTNTSCSGSPVVRTGMVRSVKNHLIIVSDTSNPAGGFTTAQYDSIALEFDTLAWPADSANFGAPTDVDGNGHVVAFFTRAVNELSPPASSSVTLGFFASKDVFSNDPVEGCSNSNMGEMFYMLVPDPTGAVNSNVRTVPFVRGNTTGTLGHEFQHMINAFRRAYVTGATSFEQGFLNEGLSHVAEELMFYRASVGLAPRQNIVVGNLTTGPNASRRVAAFNTYANQNFGRLRGWLQRPDTTGAFKNNANSLAVRGAIWAFLRYSADRVNGDDQTFWYNMVNSNLEGKANIQNAIGTNPDLWLRDWTASMYADDNAFGVAPAYQNPSWSYRSMYTALNGSYQLVPRPLTNNTGLTLTYSAGGGTAYTRFGVPQGGFATVTGYQAGNTIPTSPYALIVVRTK